MACSTFRTSYHILCESSQLFLINNQINCFLMYPFFLGYTCVGLWLEHIFKTDVFLSTKVHLTKWFPCSFIHQSLSSLIPFSILFDFILTHLFLSSMYCSLDTFRQNSACFSQTKLFISHCHHLLECSMQQSSTYESLLSYNRTGPIPIPTYVLAPS